MQRHSSGKNSPEKNNQREHLTDVDAQRYIENDLDNEAMLAIQHHLNGCSLCFDLIASVQRENLNLEDHDEIARLVSEYDFNVDSQLQRLVDEGLVKPQPIPPPPSLLVAILGALRAVRNHTRPYFIYAGTVAAVALFAIFVGAPQYFAWRSDHLVEKTLVAMIDNYKFEERDIPRPAGGFEYQEFQRTRGPAESDEPKIIGDLRRALEFNDKNAKASEYLGTYFLLEKGDLQKAHEAYDAAFSRDSTNAAILNDQGVLAWHEEEYDLAEKKFALAIQFDPYFAEAQYNLALLYQQRGQKQQAIEAWKRYLEIDNQSEWKIIAETHLEKLMQE